MRKSSVPPADATQLRRRAEERLKKKPGRPAGKGATPRSEEEAQRLVQELQVHQIELEMQNEELQRSRTEVEALLAQYTDLYDFAPVGYFTLGRDGAIRRVNLTGARLLGLERKRLTGRRLGLFVSDGDRHTFNTFLDKVFAGGTQETCEATLRRDEGCPPLPGRSDNRRLGETDQSIVQIKAIASEDGQECRAVLADITKLKQAEAQVLASLREKETLLREIHHRVKNNLQVVSSLLSLQSVYLKDKRAIEIFDESRSRINTIAMVHTKLYQSKNLAAVDCADFIEDSADGLLQIYGGEAAAVKIRTDARGVFLDIDLAIPCGLILNELIANALKHAFPDKREGEIRIAMREDGGRYILTVTDNGAGFPDGINFRDTASLGLQLVDILVKQLQGRIALETNGGTAFVVSFPAKDPVKEADREGKADTRG
ncbi:MAG: ATP-binding protein [Deltaproteobacteria bacterium]|nr:ATP-binding protein [Deltaproteobacteria bacterium]